MTAAVAWRVFGLQAIQRAGTASLGQLKSQRFHGRWQHKDETGGQWSARLHEDWRLIFTDRLRPGQVCKVHVYHPAARSTIGAFVTPCARAWALDVWAEAIALADDEAGLG